VAKQSRKLLYGSSLIFRTRGGEFGAVFVRYTERGESVIETAVDHMTCVDITD
jgi:hypothetical protein